MIKNNTGIQASSTVKPVTHNKAMNTKKSPTIKNTDGHVKIIDAKEFSSNIVSQAIDGLVEDIKTPESILADIAKKEHQDTLSRLINGEQQTTSNKKLSKKEFMQSLKEDAKNKVMKEYQQQYDDAKKYLSEGVYDRMTYNNRTINLTSEETRRIQLHMGKIDTAIKDINQKKYQDIFLNSYKSILEVKKRIINRKQLNCIKPSSNSKKKIPPIESILNKEVIMN
jgi:hypothetical protein